MVTNMTTKSWIEEIREFVRKAMNKGLYINAYKVEDNLWDKSINYYFNFENNINISVYCGDNTSFIITTGKGYYKTNIDLTRRDFLELDALIVSVEEYREDIALEEFENFLKDENEEGPKKIDDIDDLDDD